MSGRDRTTTVTALAGSSALTGALAGGVLGAVWGATGAGRPSGPAAGLIVAVAVVADAVAERVPSLAALSVRRQVPIEWGRILSPAIAATLYGARLGVGPLTVLNTWLWWAMAVLAAAAGPGWAALVGAWFGASRAATTVVAGPRSAEAGPAHSATLARAEVVWSSALRLVAVLVAVAVVAAGCSDDGGGGASAGTSSSTSPSPRASTTVAAHPLDSELARAALGSPPSEGFVLAVEGALDLEAAVALEEDQQAERALLETREFERGYRRVWERPVEGAGGDGGAAGGRGSVEVAAAFVYEFASPGGAEAYLTDGLITLEGFGARLIDVDTVEGAQGFAQGGDAESGGQVAYGAVFTRGPRFFLLLRTGPSSATSPDDVRRLAAAQAAHLAEGG